MASLITSHIENYSTRNVDEFLSTEVTVTAPAAAVEFAAGTPEALDLLIVASSAAGAAASALLGAAGEPLCSVKLHRDSVSLFEVAPGSALAVIPGGVDDAAETAWLEQLLARTKPRGIVVADVRPLPVSIVALPPPFAVFSLATDAAATGGGDIPSPVPPPLMLDGCAAAAFEHAMFKGVPCVAVRMYASLADSCSTDGGIAVGKALAGALARVRSNIPAAAGTAAAGAAAGSTTAAAAAAAAEPSSEAFAKRFGAEITKSRASTRSITAASMYL